MNDLVLVPTPNERKIVCEAFESQREWKALRNTVSVQLCGFGAIAAAAVASRRIATLQPTRVMLVGIAGTFDVDVAPIGQAVQFRSVRCDGIGVGCGEDFQSAQSLGWDPLDGIQLEEPRMDEPLRDSVDRRRPVGDVLSLAGMPGDGVSCESTLLTVCSASANFDQARSRRRQYPDAVAEDMEGYGVALACQLSRTPLHLVRGISNLVGDRNHEHWQIERALNHAARLTLDLLSISH